MYIRTWEKQVRKGFIRYNFNQITQPGQPCGGGGGGGRRIVGGRRLEGWRDGSENLCEIKTCCCLAMQCRMNTQERTAVWTVGLGVMVWRCRLIVYNKWTTPGRDLGNWAGCAYSAAGACVFSAQFFSWSQTKIEWCLCKSLYKLQWNVASKSYILSS